jgi:hypothetical protein
MRRRLVRSFVLVLSAGMVAGLAGPLGAGPASAVLTRSSAAASTPTASPDGPLYGALVKPTGSQSYQQALAASEGRYGRLGIVRYFDGAAPEPWSALNAKLTDHTSIVSFRYLPSSILNGSHDADLRAWFASAPTDHLVYWSYLHEPEDDIARGTFTAADYRAAWAHIAAIATSVNNPELRATLILMCWSVRPAAHRNWQDYYSPGSIQVIAWDCYNAKYRTAEYGLPTTIMGAAIAISQQLGLEWGIAELGSVKVSGDPTGSRRAAWLARCATYLQQQGASFVAYFDINGKKTDYRLLDQPSITEWASLVQSTDGTQPLLTR